MSKQKISTNMRRTHFVSSCALIILFATACQTTELDIRTESPAVAEPCEISCTMSATMPEFKVGGDPETKSSLESVVRVKWKKNDELSVINLTTGKQLGGCIKADNDGANSTFSPSGLHGTITAGDKLVFLLDNDPGRRSATEKDFEPFTMDYSSQKGNSNEVPIVVYANYTATENGTINAVNPEFNFLMGYVQLAVSALPASTSVTELGIENLNTRCQFSISNHEFVTTPQNGNITLSEAFTANSKGTNTRYFSCFTSPAQGEARNAHIHANSINHITAWLKAALSAGYYYQSVATGFTNENISFVDDTFKSYCVSHYDKNGDGEISFAEAAAVTSFESFTAAEKSSIKEVFELPYFFKGERIPSFDGCTTLKQVILPGTLQTIQENAFKGCTGLEVITIPSTVTTIGEGAFEGCTSLVRFDGTYASADRRYIVRDNHVLAFAPGGLTETTVPDGVTTINAGVFANNTTIKTVNLSAQLTTVEARAFKGCTALPIIRFRTQIASIGEEAFKGCSALRSIYSDAITPPTVGTDAFANCHASLAAHVTAGTLSAYEANSSWNAIGVSSTLPWNEIWYTTTDNNICNPSVISQYQNSFISNTYVDGKGILLFNQDLTALPAGFGNITTLSSIQLPDSIESIQNNAFYGCTALSSISLSASLNTIGNSVFRDCSSLLSIVIPEAVTVINDYTFYNCSALTSITLPNSIQSIGMCALAGCSSLESFTVPDSLQSSEYGAFGGCTGLTAVYANPSLFAGISFHERSSNPLSEAHYLYTKDPIPQLVTELIIPNTITTISNSIFAGCQCITSIIVPSSVEVIEYDAFGSCSSLVSVTLSSGLKTLKNEVFRYDNSLTTITIPETIESFKGSTFYGCQNLQTVYIKATTPPSLTENIFTNNFSLTNVYVPTSSVDAYKTAWSSYISANKITGYDFE